jgi:hypothetical protein
MTTEELDQFKKDDQEIFGPTPHPEGYSIDHSMAFSCEGLILIALIFPVWVVGPFQNQSVQCNIAI